MTPRRKNELFILLILLAFAAGSAVRHLPSFGGDLSSSYFGCRVLAESQPSHLYARDPINYNSVGDPVWSRLVRLDGSTVEKYVQPYVQTPLWAYSLEPLCTHMSFAGFHAVFTVIVSCCFSVVVWIIARFWTSALYRPGWIALVCAALYFSEAYKYAMLLTQTHILFILLALAALVCAGRKHAGWAGLLLALAAAVKVTPGLLLLYWLVKGEKRAALSFCFFSILLVGASVLVAGWGLNITYLHNLSRISNILLVSYNNQSLAAVWMAGEFPPTELKQWHSHFLPASLKLICTVLSVASALAGGWLDRNFAERAPYGAAFAIVGSTMFTPIAWSHYYVVLLLPLMMMLDVELRSRSLPLFIAIATIFVLNFDMTALGGFLLRFEPFSIVRAQFYSGLLCLGVLAVLSRRYTYLPGSGNLTKQARSPATLEPAKLSSS